MNATQRSTRDQRTVTWGVDDGEIRPVQYSSVGRRYRVDQLIAKFERVNDEPFRIVVAEFKGQALKQDGTDSLNRATERLWSSDRYPDWLQHLIDQELREINRGVSR